MSGLSCGMQDLHWGMQDLLLWCAGFSLIVACGFSLSSCGMWAPESMGSVVCGIWALSLRRVSSIVVAHVLSCPAACGNLSSLTRDWTRILCIVRRIVYHWTTREVPKLNFLIFITALWLCKRIFLLLNTEVFVIKGVTYPPTYL